MKSLMLCPKTWKMHVLFNEYKINYEQKMLPLNHESPFPIINEEYSDLSYILFNLDEFLLPQDKIIYGKWINYIDCDFIPNIINPIKTQRLINPIIYQKNTDLNILSELRKKLKTYLKFYSDFLENHSWINSSNFTLIDITLSSAIAILDYLGEINWKNSEIQFLYQWYIKIKSRNSFQIILNQECIGIKAHLNFKKIDF